MTVSKDHGKGMAETSRTRQLPGQLQPAPGDDDINESITRRARAHEKFFRSAGPARVAASGRPVINLSRAGGRAGGRASDTATRASASASVHRSRHAVRD